LDLPAIAIPLLADVTKRHIEKPEDGKNGSIGEAGGHDAGEDEADPGAGQEGGIGVGEPEDGGKAIKGGAFVTQAFDDASQEAVDRGEAVRADQGDDLVDHYEKGDRIYDAQQAKDEETGKPVGGAVGHIRRIFL